MISYDRLWETMGQQGATTYTLQIKDGVSSSTIRRMKARDSVSANTLVSLCKILNCRVEDLIEFIPNRG